MAFMVSKGGERVRDLRNEEIGLGWSTGSTRNKSGLDDAPTVGSGGSDCWFGFGLGRMGSMVFQMGFPSKKH